LVSKGCKAASINEEPVQDKSSYEYERQDAVGQSEAFLDFQERLSRVGPVERPVLVIGERGSGKELAARRIHFLSKRWQEPLIELNCAALAQSLIESELFGHEPGAFTGATTRRRGRFEAADGGTLFLDELGNVPLQVQEKILRVVEYGVFERVGGSEQVRVDVRIVAATNADLPKLADEGRFMRDLLDRLSFDVIYVPPLRDRKEDILLLAHHFASRMAAELGRDDIPEFSERVAEALERHPWRGNVRELKNTIERAVYQSASASISHVQFDPFESPYAPAPGCAEGTSPAAAPAATQGGVSLPIDFDAAIAAYELCLLTAALDRAKHNQRKAAELLGLSYNQFRGLFRKYQAHIR
jgi:psp operon transcriptional activator